MKNLILKLGVFLGIMMLFFLFLNWYYQSNTFAVKSDYMTAIIDKKELCEQTPSPKIIFAGGSNLVFGINSKSIEDQINVPVVNLGLHAGLGVEFILNNLKKSVSSSDLIIISLEYFIDSKGDENLINHTQQLYEAPNFNLIKDIYHSSLLAITENQKLIKQFFDNDDTLVQHFKNKEVYQRSSFNQQGDLILPIGKKNQQSLIGKQNLQYEYWNAIDLMNDSYRELNNKNIYFLYPPYPKSEYLKNKNAIEKLHRDLTSNLIFKVIGKPSDFIYEDSLFFDTVYHLNLKGKQLRTAQIIEYFQEHKNCQIFVKKSLRKLPQ